MSSSTPTPAGEDVRSATCTGASSETSKPTILHLGDDIRWNHALYKELGEKFHIERSYSMDREDFKRALRDRRWGDFVGMYRPFWNTGGEMGNWDEELMYVLHTPGTQQHKRTQRQRVLPPS